MNMHDRNMRRGLENMSLQPGSRQQPAEADRVTLPGFHHIAAGAGRGEDFRVLQPQREFPLQYGQRPQQGAVHHPQASAAYRPHQPHASIESTPSTTFSSPRTAYNDHYFDNSSVSSSSRESSAFPGGSVSSVITASTARLKRSSRSTRTKRGSESQESDRDAKRPSRATASGSDSEGSWCRTCHTSFGECSSPKVHSRKGTKIVNEKKSRNAQAIELQNDEDRLQFALGWAFVKPQLPGNEKRSGLVGDKQHTIVGTSIALDMAIQEIALRPEEFEAFKHRVRDAINDHIATGPSTKLPANSLLAGPSGEQLCYHVANGIKCDDLIRCRKGIRKMNIHNNLAHITGTSSGASTVRSSPVGGRSGRH